MTATKIIMEAEDEINRLRSILDSACTILEVTGKLPLASSKVRDYWGERRAEFRRKANCLEDRWT